MKIAPIMLALGLMLAPAAFAQAPAATATPRAVAFAVAVTVTVALVMLAAVVHQHILCSSLHVVAPPSVGAVPSIAARL